jgi:ABC-type xylose transport system permease subunit
MKQVWQFLAECFDDRQFKDFIQHEIRNAVQFLIWLVLAAFLSWAITALFADSISNFIAYWSKIIILCMGMVRFLIVLARGTWRLLRDDER